MSIKRLLTGAVISAGMLFGAVSSASAQTEPSPGCEITEITSASKATDLYLKAETALLIEDNPSAANGFLSQMRALDLNCFEESILLAMSAQVKISLEDYAGAVRDLETRVQKQYIQPSQLPQTYLAIGQLYFQEGELEKGLDYHTRWINAGGKPSRDQKYTLAQVNYNLDKFPEALVWLEQVFAADGPGADRAVYDFLILLYDRTGNKAKKAQLLEQLLVRNPSDRRVWDAISGDYYQGNQERKAFEVQKAMYLGGILETENELLRIVNFYNQFDAPYEGARILEKEINAGRIEASYKQLELLSRLYQVAREPNKAVPVIERAAQQFDSAVMYERLGRAYGDLREWAKAEEALLKAFDASSGTVEDRGLAWVFIGQSRYERGDREGAREAFRNANNRGGRGWLDFMRSEDQTEIAFRRFRAQQDLTKFQNEKKGCDRLKVLGDQLPDGCATVDERIAEAQERLNSI